MPLADPRFQELEAALQAAVEPEFRDRQQHFHKIPVETLGVRTGNLRVIGKAHFPPFKRLPLPEFLNACEVLLSQRASEYRCIGFAWAHRRGKEFGPEEYQRLEHWLATHVHNWSDCDQLCCEVFGDFMRRHPSFARHTLEWANSENRWMRRAAAVILIPDLRKEATFLDILFEVAKILMPDQDDLVQKAYGWALKVATKNQAAATFAFIMAHRHTMSRTALRYAIEKLPPEQRSAALQS